MSQQMTVSGEDKKNASTTCLIFLHGPHQDAPSFKITKPGLLFFNNDKNSWRELNVEIIVLDITNE